MTAEDDGVAGLVRRCVRDGFEYAGATFRMARHEAGTAARRAARRIAVLGLALFLAGSGLLLLFTGLALLLGEWLAAPWAGFLIAGCVLAGAGVPVAIVLARSLADPALGLPATRAEIREDIECVRNGVPEATRATPSSTS